MKGTNHNAIIATIMVLLLVSSITTTTAFAQAPTAPPKVVYLPLDSLWANHPNLQPVKRINGHDMVLVGVYIKNGQIFEHRINKERIGRHRVQLPDNIGRFDHIEVATLPMNRALSTNDICEFSDQHTEMIESLTSRFWAIMDWQYNACKGTILWFDGYRVWETWAQTRVTESGESDSWVVRPTQATTYQWASFYNPLTWQSWTHNCRINVDGYGRSSGYCW